VSTHCHPYGGHPAPEGGKKRTLSDRPSVNSSDSTKTRDRILRVSIVYRGGDEIRRTIRHSRHNCASLGYSRRRCRYRGMLSRGADGVTDQSSCMPMCLLEARREPPLLRFEDSRSLFRDRFPLRVKQRDAIIRKVKGGTRNASHVCVFCICHAMSSAVNLKRLRGNSGAAINEKVSS